MKPASATPVLISGACELLPPPSPAPGPEQAVTLAIIEADAAIRESLRALLEGAPGMRCVALHANIAEALLTLPRFRPEVVLLDARFLTVHGPWLVTRFKAQAPATQILVLTTFEAGELTFNAVCQGASGDLPKTTPALELAQVVQWVQAGGSPMSMSMARRVMAHFQSRGAADRNGQFLTGQEEELVASLARGMSYQATADKFGATVLELLVLLRGVYGRLGRPGRVT